MSVSESPLVPDEHRGTAVSANEGESNGVGSSGGYGEISGQFRCRLIQELATSSKFFAGNARFLTRKLWGVANTGPFMHHGKFTTMRGAVLAHAAEALGSSLLRRLRVNTHLRIAADGRISRSWGHFVTCVAGLIRPVVLNSNR